jgi:hypothetical protein
MTILPEDLPAMDPEKGFVPVDNAVLGTDFSVKDWEHLIGRNVIATILDGRVLIGLMEVSNLRMTIGNSDPFPANFVESMREV